MSLPAKRLLSAWEFERMAQAQILGEDERLELVEGEILQMSPIGPRHAACVNRLTKLLFAAVQDRLIVSVHNPLRLGKRSELQPDLALLRHRPDFYAAAHPGPADVLLWVEAADTGTAYDRSVKLPLLARAGIPVVWLVDLGANRLETHTDPSADGYAQESVLERDDRVAVPGLPDAFVPIGEVLA